MEIIIDEDKDSVTFTTEPNPDFIKSEKADNIMEIWFFGFLIGFIAGYLITLF